MGKCGICDEKEKRKKRTLISLPTPRIRPVDLVMETVARGLLIHQPGHLCGVASSSYGDPTEDFVDLGQVGVVELDLSKVLDNARRLGGARNRHDGREAGFLTLSADPCNSDLRGRDAFSLRDLFNFIHQLEVFSENIFLKAGHPPGDIAFGDVIPASDLAREESAREGGLRNNGNSELGADGSDAVVLDVCGEEGKLDLDC